MLNWISNAVENMIGWVGNGTASLIEWLLGGLADMVQLIFDAAASIFNVFDSLWNLGTSLIGSLFNLVNIFFPFLPEPVSNTISAGLIVVVVAGIVKKVKE